MFDLTGGDTTGKLSISLVQNGLKHLYLFIICTSSKVHIYRDIYRKTYFLWLFY